MEATEVAFAKKKAWQRHPERTEWLGSDAAKNRRGPTPPTLEPQVQLSLTSLHFVRIYVKLSVAYLQVYSLLVLTLNDGAFGLQVLFKYPPAKRLPLKSKDLPAFCFPGGVEVNIFSTERQLLVPF